MQKPLAVCLAGLLLLAGCIGSDDDDVADEIIGCEDESSLTYVEDATEFREDFCVYEDDLENSIFDFIEIIEYGPSMNLLVSTIGYSMEVSQIVDNEAWNYNETMIVSPNGSKLIVEDNYGENKSSFEIISSGNEIQYRLIDEQENFTSRMKHSDGAIDDLTSTISSGDENWEYYALDEDSVNLDENGNPEASFYTGLYNPISATITSFTPDETGYKFSGKLNSPGYSFNYFEIHTDSDFEVLGFTMKDTGGEDYWVKFTIIKSGEISIDKTIPLSALPYTLVNMTEVNPDYEIEFNDPHWYPYFGGYCEWEGDSDEATEAWWCKEKESDTEWESWWFYCELHDDDWFCTDDFGQSSDYENSIDWGQYDLEHGEELNDATITLRYFDVINWDSTNDLQQIVDWFDDNYDYAEDEDVMTVDDFLYYCGATPDYVDNDIATCVLEAAKDMIGVYSDEQDTVQCITFVGYNSEGMEIFDNSTLDFSMCGTEIGRHHDYTFTNTGFTIPNDIIYDSCYYNENNDCESGTIYFDRINGEVIDTQNEPSSENCDGNYDYDGGLCTSILGGLDEFDEDAFTLKYGWSTSLVMYQYDTETMSGVLMLVGAYQSGMICFNPYTGEMTEDDEAGCLSYSYLNNQTINGVDICYNAYSHHVSFIDNTSCSSYTFYNVTAPSGSGQYCYNNASHSFNDDDENTCTQYAYYENQSWGPTTFTGCYNMGVHQTNSDSKEVCESYAWYNTSDVVDAYCYNLHLHTANFNSNFSECASYMFVEDYGPITYTGCYNHVTRNITSQGENDCSTHYWVNSSIDYDLMEVFLMIDYDRNGELNLDEWSSVMGNTSEESGESGALNMSTILTIYDENDSGGLNFIEFVNMMSETDSESQEMGTATWFRWVDSNNDDQVTANEWSDFLNNTGSNEIEFSEIEYVFTVFDHDGDGVLDLSEFSEMVESTDASEIHDPNESLVIFVVDGPISVGGGLGDYSIALTVCDYLQNPENPICEQNTNIGSLSNIVVDQSRLSLVITERQFMFVDTDYSDSLTSGDLVIINTDAMSPDSVFENIRLYSEEADEYTDENQIIF